MKVLIFENQFDQLATIFEAVNLIYFQKKLTWEVFANSQDIGDLKLAKQYDFIFVDIDLAKRSDMDGFQLIESMSEIGIPKQKICILTGWINVSEELQRRGISDMIIVNKPPSIDTIYGALRQGNLI